MLGTYDPARGYKPSERAVGWIYGRVFVRSDVPGYRSLSLDGVTRTVAGSALDAWELLEALDTALGASNWDVNIDGSAYWLGRVSVSRTVRWLDRLGWLLGFDAEPDEEEAPTEALWPRAPSPILIPLLSCEREEIPREQARRLQLDRFGRGFGDSFGDAETRRFRVMLDRPGFEALKAGWCLGGGIVTISPYTAAQHIAGTVTAFSATSPIGYHRGRVLGVEAGRWLDNAGPHRLYETSIVLATEVG